MIALPSSLFAFGVVLTVLASFAAVLAALAWGASDLLNAVFATLAVGALVCFSLGVVAVCRKSR